MPYRFQWRPKVDWCRSCVRRLPLVLSLLLVVAPAAAGERKAGERGTGQPPRYGGIELGAQGIKGVVIELDAGGDLAGGASPEESARVLAAGPSENVGLASALEPDGQGVKHFRTDAIAFTVEAINNFKREFSRRHNIPANRIIVAMSSGLAMAARDFERERFGRQGVAKCRPHANGSGCRRH